MNEMKHLESQKDILNLKLKKGKKQHQPLILQTWRHYFSDGFQRK